MKLNLEPDARIIVSPTAGFCFGVSKAVSTVESLLDAGERVATLGPLIHNPTYLQQIAARGVVIVDTPDAVPTDAHLVVRAHGIPRQVKQQLDESGIAYSDMTCPFVQKIQRIVAENTGDGAVLLIAGDETHPEVVGFRSYAGGASFVFSSCEQMEKILRENDFPPETPFILVGQTTFHEKEFGKCKISAKNLCTNLKIFDTICNATSKRQKDACNLSMMCDIVIIIGGKISSNTQKLRAVCEPNARTYLIETAEDLAGIDFSGCKTVGVTAGASTPVCIIKEVVQIMSENVINPEEAVEAVEQTAAPAEETVEAVAEPVAEEAPAAPADADADVSFVEGLEESLKGLNSNQSVVGTVLRVGTTEIQVDIGRKQAGFVPFEEFSDDPGIDPAKEVKVGDELNLIIMKVNDAEGTVMLSKKRYDTKANWDLLVAAKEENSILEGTVTEVVNKGVRVYYKGIKVFIPASRSGQPRNGKLEDLLNQTVRFRIIDIDTRRKSAVGSIKDVKDEEIKASVNEFWSNVAVGQRYTGKVVSVPDSGFGVFVEVAPGVQGLCHRTELTWERGKNPADLVKVGDEIDVVVIRYAEDEKHPGRMKLSLSHKLPELNPVAKFQEMYPVGSVADAVITRLTTFGAFAKIDPPGAEGLIHVSQIANHRVENPGDVLSVGQAVKVKITEIDTLSGEKPRISLSMKALLEDEAPAYDDDYDDYEDEIPEGTPISLEDAAKLYSGEDAED